MERFICNPNLGKEGTQYLNKSNQNPIITAINQLVDQWNMNDMEITALLGLTHETWALIKINDFIDPLSDDVITRAEILMRIDRDLEVIFGGNAETRWVKLANSSSLFNGETPVNYMIKGGLPAMLAVRNYLEAVMYS